MSTGYVGSGGTKFKDELSKQRKKTDEMIKRFKAEVYEKGMLGNIT